MGQTANQSAADIQAVQQSDRAAIKAAIDNQRALAFRQGARAAAPHAWAQTAQAYPG